MPNSLCIPRSEEGDKKSSASICKLPSGVLRVQMMEAKNLETADVSIYGRTSDPYAVFNINGDGNEVKVCLTKLSKCNTQQDC